MLSEQHMASASYSLAGPSKRNVSKPALPPEATNPGNGHGNRMGPSSSWISSLPRVSSAKWYVVIFSGSYFSQVRDWTLPYLLSLSQRCQYLWLFCIVFLAVGPLKKILVIHSLKLQMCCNLMLCFHYLLERVSAMHLWSLQNVQLMWCTPLVPVLMPTA